MKDIPEELRAKVRKYSLMVAWWYIHEGDKTMDDKRKEVQGKIEQTEDELRLSGVSNDTLGGIIDKAKEFVKLKVGEMSDKQLETVCKLIFGQGTTLTTVTKEELSRLGVIMFDPIKYAERVKENMQVKLNV